MPAHITKNRTSLSAASPILEIPFLQTGFIFTKEPLKFSLGKLKPKLGFKNIFSKRSLLNLAKNIVVIVISGYMAYKYITNNYERIMAMSNLNLQSIIIEFRKNSLIFTFYPLLLASVPLFFAQVLSCK